jgi:hypothetical protein
MSEMVTDAGGQLINAIAEAVSAKLLKLLDTKQRLLDVEAAACYLGMTPIALRHKVSLGEIPNVKIDGKLRFDKRDLDRYIDRAPREGV